MMSKPLSIIGFIPARAGSKGLHNKNILPLCGKPLIQHTIESALASKLFSEVVVSSDGTDILRIAENLGVTALTRPHHLSTDNASTACAIKHMIESRHLNNESIIVLLQPTSPLRTEKHILEAFNLYCSTKVPVVSVEDTLLFPSKYLMLIDSRLQACDPNEVTSARQSLKSYIKPNGALYIFSINQFFEVGDVPINGSVPYYMDKFSSVDIDQEIDLKLAKIVLENEYVFHCRP